MTASGAVLAVAWLMTGIASAEVKTVGGQQVFENDWCFCLMPKLVPESPASVSSVAYAVAAGAGGKLAVAGTESRSATGSGWRVNLYGADGALAWSRSFIWQQNFYEVARGVAVGPDGAVAAAGYSEYARGAVSPAGFLVAAYAADGTPRWRDIVTSAATTRAESVVVDRHGDTVVAGWIQRSMTTGATWLVRKYSSTGDLRWSRTFGGAANGMHRAFAVALDGASDVLVAGTTDLGGARTAWTLRLLDAKGGLRWTRSTMGASSWLDAPHAVAIAGDGRIAVAGRIAAGVAQAGNWQVEVWSRDGVLLWTRSVNGAASKDDKAFAVAFDGCGRVFVAGYDDGDAALKAPYDAGRWTIRVFDRSGGPVGMLDDAQLGTAGGGAFGLAVEGTTVAAVGFEKAAEEGKTKWVIKRMPGLGCLPSGSEAPKRSP